MTSLRDRAEGGGPEVVLVADQPHRGAVDVASDELEPADELTPEGQFPEHGVFLPVEPVDGDGMEYWEAPKALAQVVVETADEEEVAIPALRVSVDEVVKTPGGEWRYTASVRPQDDD